MSVAAPDGAAPAQQVRVELGDVFARYADQYFGSHGVTQAQRKVFRAKYIERLQQTTMGANVVPCRNSWSSTLGTSEVLRPRGLPSGNPNE